MVEKILEFLRSSVRPILTYMFSAIFSYMTIKAVNKFMDETMARAIVDGFVGLTGFLIGYYVGQRQNQSPK